MLEESGPKKEKQKRKELILHAFKLPAAQEFAPNLVSPSGSLEVCAACRGAPAQMTPSANIRCMASVLVAALLFRSVPACATGLVCCNKRQGCPQKQENL